MKLVIQDKFSGMALRAAGVADRFITRNEVTIAQQAFREHYFAKEPAIAGGAISSNFSDVFEADWKDFKRVIINECIGQIATSPDGTDSVVITANNLLLRFIFRYDLPAANWYLTMQSCAMVHERNDPGISKVVYDVYESNIFHKIVNAYSPIILDTNPTHFATNYFNNFYYSTDGGATTVNLTSDDSSHSKYVGNVLFPWDKEIKELAEDNDVYDPTESQIVRLKFFSCSFQFSLPSSYAGIEWPHGVLLCINENGRDRLKNRDSVLSFCDLAANFGTMCPPNCFLYIVT